MNTPCGLAASMAAGNSPNPTKTGVATFLSGVTSALSSDDWLTGHTAESRAESMNRKNQQFLVYHQTVCQDNFCVRLLTSTDDKIADPAPLGKNL